MARRGGTTIWVERETLAVIDAVIAREEARGIHERVTKDDVVRGAARFFLTHDIPVPEVRNNKMGRRRKAQTDGGTES